MQLRARQLLSGSPSTSTTSSLSSSTSPSPASPDACDEQKVAELLEELVLNDLDDTRTQLLHGHDSTSWQSTARTSLSSNSPSPIIAWCKPSLPIAATPPPSHSSPTSPTSAASALSSPIRLSFDDYLCPICLSLLVDPLTLPCQHSFCRHCLVACFELAAKRCPQCRAPADSLPPVETLGANTLLVRLLREAWGEKYKERDDSLAEVRAGYKRKFPVYFSHELTFPYQTLLLNLHEARYQLMHKRLSASKPADGKRRFAILPRQQTAEGSVGVLCELSTETERHQGAGVFHVVTTQRFTVESVWQEDGTHGLHYARVHVLEDVDEAADVAVRQCVERIHQSIQLYNSVCPFPMSFHGRFGTVPTQPHQLSFWLFQSLAVDTAAVSVERGRTASLLESRSLLWRLGLGEELMQQLVSRALAEHDMLQSAQPQADLYSQQRSRPQLQPHAPSFHPASYRAASTRLAESRLGTEEAERQMNALARWTAPQPQISAAPSSPEQLPVPPAVSMSPPLLPESPQQVPLQPTARQQQRQRYRIRQQQNNTNRRYPRPFAYQQQQQQQQQHHHHHHHQYQQQQSPPLQSTLPMPAADTSRSVYQANFGQFALPPRMDEAQQRDMWRMWQPGQQSGAGEQHGRTGQSAPHSPFRPYTLF